MTPRQKALRIVQELEELAELDRRRAALINQINRMLQRISNGVRR